MSPTDEGGRLVDPDVLRELTEFRMPGEPDPVEDVVDLFLEVTPERLRDLARAAAEGNHQAVREIAHLLKGSAASLGANAMQAAAADVEQSAGEDSVDRVVQRLVEVFDRSRPALMALVADLRPADL